MKVGSKDAADSAASFALLFVKNYAILDLSDKISTGGWWIPKCCLFAPLKSDNAHTYIHVYKYKKYKYTSTYSIQYMTYMSYVMYVRITCWVQNKSGVTFD